MPLQTHCNAPCAGFCVGARGWCHFGGLDPEFWRSLQSDAAGLDGAAVREMLPARAGRCVLTESEGKIFILSLSTAGGQIITVSLGCCGSQATDRASRHLSDGEAFQGPDVELIVCEAWGVAGVEADRAAHPEILVREIAEEGENL